MGKYNFSDLTTTELRTLTNKVAIHDDDGRLLGYFEPTNSSTLGYEEPSEEELTRRENGPLFTTAQVLEHLKGLDRS